MCGFGPAGIFAAYILALNGQNPIVLERGEKIEDTYEIFLFKKGNKFKVELDVTNISNIDGKEVVQLYISELIPNVYRPVRELKAFEKVFVKANETKHVTFILDKKAFEYYSTSYDKWVVNNGLFEVQIGKNVSDIVLVEQIEVNY